MTTSTGCQCQSHAQGPCERGALERPRYFPRQLLTPDEMTLEQQYFRDRARRHNRLLHGWGVACGAAVCPVADPATGKPVPWMVGVAPGYVLGPYGDEILIDQEQQVDLRTSGKTAAAGDPSGDAADPWCTEVLVPRTGGPLYVAVRYQEVMSRPVRVSPAGCGCDDAQCEYSRWCDGFEIGVLTACPESHALPPSFDDLFKGPIPPCPPCPAEPWVVLAKVEIDKQGAVLAIDNCSCRRLLVSWGALWWQCQGDPCLIRKVEVEGGDPRVERDQETWVYVAGRAFPEDVQASMGDGLDTRMTSRSADASSLRVRVAVTKDAVPGWHSLVLADAANRTLAVQREVLYVVAASPPPPAPPPPKPAPPAGGATDSAPAGTPAGGAPAGPSKGASPAGPAAGSPAGTPPAGAPSGAGTAGGQKDASGPPPAAPGAEGGAGGKQAAGTGTAAGAEGGKAPAAPAAAAPRRARKGKDDG